MFGLVVSSILGFCFGVLVTFYVWPKLRITQPLPAKRKRHPTLNAQIEEILRPFKFDLDSLRKLQSTVNEELSKGLSSVTHDTADVKMFSSYVRHLPVGNERGNVLALDLGGTNLRVLRVTLHGRGRKPSINSKVFVVPRSVMIGSGKKLFAHLAECLHRFLEADRMLGESLTLGFTFSFPCVQCGISSARLTAWTKGFSCEGVVGQDVVSLLQEAIDNIGIRVKVSALINDTVGTLMACAYGKPKTSIGLIVGTGFNACYVERLSRVGTWDGDYDEPSHVIINTEWGGLGNSGSVDWIRTSFDREVDKSSINPGRQIYEKLVSGMYMGEIVRNVILSLMEKRLLFMGSVEQYKIYAAPFVTPDAFLAKYVSDIETDDGINYEKTAEVLQTLGVVSPTYEDCAIIQYVCKLVSKRAGALVAVGLACLVERILDENENGTSKEVTIGVDGSVYRYHPRFHKNIMKPLSLLLEKDVNCSLILSDDGSGIGAALVAHIDALHQISSSPTTPKVNFFVGT